MKVEAEIARAGLNSLVAMKSRSTAIGAGAGKLDATTMAGNGARAAQQSDLAALTGEDAGTQQLCAVLCVRRQVPHGAIRAAVNRIATVTRWKRPRNIAPVYHSSKFME
jgi:hypothetical protein